MRKCAICSWEMLPAHTTCFRKVNGKICRVHQACQGTKSEGEKMQAEQQTSGPLFALKPENMSKRQRALVVDQSVFIPPKAAEYIKTHASNRIRIALNETFQQISGHRPFDLIKLQNAYMGVEWERVWRGL